eukprot:5710121-Lingulodinium_polyedra.AAC.1
MEQYPCVGKATLLNAGFRTYVRYALVYPVFLAGADLHPYNYDPFTLVRGFITQHHKKVVTLGW